MVSFTWMLFMISSTTGALPNQPVPMLDLQRYAGSWHEIAHLPLRFERQCVDDVTATYTVLADQALQVRNACRTRDGSLDVAEGIARPGQVPGALKVSFAPRWLRWIRATWADYWVVEVDPQYQWAVVGSPSRKYLWILSRAPRMSSRLFGQLTQHATDRGYPVNKLIKMAPLK